MANTSHSSNSPRTMWLLLLFLVGCSFVSNAQEDPGWTPGKYPNPSRQPRLCGRVNRTSSFVCDPDGILTRTEADHLDLLLFTTLRDTPCPCETCPGENDGYNIAVALMKRMSKSGIAASSPRVRAQGFAMYLRAIAWDYGTCNEGVVILVSTEDRQIYTATGATAREKLIDAIVDNIYVETREYFTTGRWAAGVSVKGVALELVVAIISMTIGTIRVITVEGIMTEGVVVVVIAAVVVVVIVGVVGAGEDSNITRNVTVAQLVSAS
ncbi:uncharacterized protein LOC118424283 [Branchiostoma floridae]|uniref:Uncharacterized protein LOC118424283 n=1 Tax=Branchiostoma floridae TaxID=7739 RepID=A0A9J7LWU8_BRAFL|nr:uncharacterized protein LOC118424283 [Branchiostoma floridae]